MIRPGHWLLPLLLLAGAATARAAPVELEFTKGVVAFGQGDARAAERHFRQVLGERPDHHQALYYLGQALFSQGRFDEAARLFRRVLELQPARQQVKLDLALVLVKQEKFTAAEQVLAGASGEITGRASWNYYLGYCRYRLGRLEEALEPLQQARRLDQGFASAASYYLGMAYAGLGRQQQAQRLFGRLAEQEAADHRLSSFARRNLEVLEGLAGREGQKSWWLLAAAGGGWDSNVTLDTQDPGRAAAGVVFLSAAGGWRPALGRDDRMEFSARLFRSFHTSAETEGYNLTDASARLGWNHRFGGGHGLGLQYDFDLQLLDGAAALAMDGFGLYLHSHAGRVLLHLQEGRYSATSITYLFRASLFHSGLDVRDNFHHEGMLGQQLSLLGGRWRLLLQAGAVWEDARHEFFDQWGPLAELRSRYRFTPRLVFGVKGGWQRASYYHSGRRDDRLTAGTSLAWQLTDHLGIGVNLDFLENLSSSDDYAYRRLMVSATLAGRM